VYAAGSVEQMMTGKQFNRAVRALTLVYEALSSLWLSARLINNLHMIALKITLTYQLPNYCRKNENTKTCL
jgi:hypothetical protein